MTKNTKNILILSIILAVLAVIYTITVFNKPQAKQRKEESRLLLGTIETDDVVIIDFKNDYVLEKFGDMWALKREGENIDLRDYPVNQTVIQFFLSALFGIKKGRLVSKNPEDLSPYNLGENASHLVLSKADATQLISLQVGQSNNNSSANFVQIDDNQAIYQISNEVQSYLDNSYLDWADLRLFPDSSSVTEVSQYTIQEYDTTKSPRVLTNTLVLERGDEGWSLVGSSKKIDSVLAEKFLTDMFFLEAKDLISLNSVQEDTKIMNIEVALKSGDALVMELYSFVDNYYATTRGGRDTVGFQLSSSVVNDRFIVDKEHFFAVEVAEEEVEKAEGIDLEALQKPIE